VLAVLGLMDRLRTSSAKSGTDSFYNVIAIVAVGLPIRLPFIAAIRGIG
jgi:hypothetical protein